MLAVLFGVAATKILQLSPRTAKVVTRTPVIDAVLSDPGSPRAGASKPDVTIVVFTDYQCPICKATDPALEQLIAHDRRVQVIFKDWPILGAASRAAARAALAADRQGKYLAFHSALMASRRKLDDDEIRRIAAVSGVDWKQIRDVETSQTAELDRQLRSQAMQAFSLGLQGTPAYLVGPYLIEGGLDERHLAQAVKRARASGPPV
ncbi:MAG TPA: DsbA family protein [Phenylobacterium sp.]|nr:DsbA family protein [Phenylobacterium sp.]